jgi:putative transposase
VIKRRTDVVGVFPNPPRLAGAVLLEQHNERDAGDRCYLSEASMQELDAPGTPAAAHVQEVVPIPELAAA